MTARKGDDLSGSRYYETIERRGAKPTRSTYDTPTKLQSAIDKYFDLVLRKDVLPDEAGMLLYLGLRKRDFDYYCSDENPDHERYIDILEEAQLRRESYLSRVMSSDNKRAQGCMNALKQEKNGGYGDKPDKGAKKLEIVVSGIPGGTDAFK